MSYNFIMEKGNSNIVKDFHKNLSAGFLVLILVCVLCPKPSHSYSCADLFPRTPGQTLLPGTFKDSLVREINIVLKTEQTPELPARLKDCGPGCLELESNSLSPAVFRIEQDLKLTEPQIVFSRQTGTKTLKVPGNFFSSSSSSSVASPTKLLRRWLIGHELHPYNPTRANGRLLEKPVQIEALRAYDQAIEAGHRSFLHIAPTALGKGLVFSKALLRRVKNMEDGKKVIFVTVDRIHLVDQISSTIESLVRSKNIPPVRLINWNNRKENNSDSERLFFNEVRSSVTGETPSVFFITSQSLKLRLAGLREKDSETYRRLTSSLDSLFFDEAHHSGAYQTRMSLESLFEDSGAFLFGSTATPVHPEVRLTDLFEVNHFSYLRTEVDLSGLVSKKILLQLSRAIERGDITGFQDIYVLGETLFKRADSSEPLFRSERESGYQVINPHYYNRLVEILSPILLSNRRGFIVTASIRESERLSEYLNGVFGGTITFSPFHSQMGRRERQEVLERSEENSDRSHFIVSVRALDEGVDLPRLSAYIDLNSNVSVRQMLHRIGRVLRLSPGKLESEIVLLSDYKNRRLSEDLLELLDAMKVIPGFRNRSRHGGGEDRGVGVSGGVLTRGELSASRELLESVVRNYWSRNIEGKVGYGAFETRILEAVKRGELNPNSVVDSYRQWQRNHPDMPSTPRQTYPGQFPGWRKFFEKHGMIEIVEFVDYGAFETRILEAVERGELNPNSVVDSYRQWQRNHPDMPFNPRRIYPGQFLGWKRFFENHGVTRNVDYGAFETRILEAVERGELNPNSVVDSYRQWQRNHPDMPSTPRQTYPGQFPGWRKFFEKDIQETESN